MKLRHFLTLSWALGAALFMAPQQTHAKIFRNAYISFELSETWKCALNQLEWVCRAQGPNAAKDAVIAISAKEVGPSDSFNAYQTYLERPITPSVQKTIAKIMYKPKSVKINDHIWLDSLHYGSELPEFYTRYLVTIKEKLAILVTFSSHKNQYAKFNQDFFRAVSTLRIIASSSFLAGGASGNGIHGGTGDLFGNMNSALLSSTMEENQNSANEKSKKTKRLFMLLGVGLLAVFAFFYFSKSDKKQKKR